MKIENESICNKLDTEINLVNCSSQAIDKNIKKIRSVSLVMLQFIQKFRLSLHLTTKRI